MAENTTAKSLAELASKIYAIDQRLSALEASKPLSGCRETAWAVKLGDDGLFVGTALGDASMPRNVLFLESMPDAQALSRLLGVGEPTLVYKDTLEEVTS